MAWQSRSKLVLVDLDRYPDSGETRKIKDLDETLVETIKKLDAAPDDQAIAKLYYDTRIEINELVGALIEKDLNRKLENRRFSTSTLINMIAIVISLISLILALKK